MGKQKEKRKENKIGEAVRWLITAAVVFASLGAQMMNKSKQLVIEKQGKDIYLKFPTKWFSATKVAATSVGLGQKAKTNYNAETWQGSILIKALKLIGVNEKNMRFYQEPGGQVGIHLMNLPKEVRIHTSIQQLLDSRLFLNRNWNLRRQKKQESTGEYSNFKARQLQKKERLWNQYAGNQLLHLLMGNIEYSEDVKSTDKIFFVKRTTYKPKYSDEEQYNNPNEWQVIGASEVEDLKQNVFAAPVVNKHRISIVDNDGRVVTNAKQAKELLGMGEGRVSWDELNSEAIKQGRFIKTYPMVHEVLAPTPSVISDLACATMVDKELSECDIRNSLNLKTILGSKVGQFYAKDTENIDEEDLDHLRQIVSRFGIYTGSINLIFVDDESEIPTSGFDGNTVDRDNPSDDERPWMEAFSKEFYLDWLPPEDEPSQMGNWKNHGSNTVNNPILNKWVKHTGVNLIVGSLEVNKDLVTIPLLQVKGINE